ncbi:MAG: hypothetical protein IPM42_08700 [Saprospiraceae bacterium]|nr:hypothetical protein [Saprospiraceae bacterium]
MNAILWDGHKQLHGFLEFGEKVLEFRLKDFSDTSLSLAIAYSNIASINEHKIFGISFEGVEILSKDGRRNVFVVQDLILVKKDLNQRLNLYK